MPETRQSDFNRHNGVVRDLTESLRAADPDVVADFVSELVTISRRIEAASKPATDRCVFCEGDFPEDALNYSSGDPACAPCQVQFGDKHRQLVVR